MKFSNIPCDLKVFESENDSNLLKVKLRIVNIGKNLNKSKFSKESIEDAESTIENVPILGYLKYDEDDEVIDFDGHNMVTKIVEDANGFKVSTKYLERPIGVIPSDSEITYEEYNGETYLCATGWVWKCYANEGYTLLMNSDEKSVSMEISVSDGEVDSSDGYYDIKKFSFLGVTVLGDDVSPGIQGANIAKYSDMVNYKKAIEDIYKEIYSIKREDENVENEPVVIQREPIIEDTTIEPTVEPVVEMQTFGLSVENLRDQVYNQISTQTITKTDYWGDEYEARLYWYRDLLPNDNVAVVESTGEYAYFGIPYSVEGDTITLDFDNKKEYISEWREKTGNDVVQVTFDLERDELKDIVLAKFDAKDEEITKINTELESLVSFKESIDNANYKAQVDEISKKFNLDQEEIQELKEKALNKEIDLQQFEEKLGYMFAIKTISNVKSEKENFASKEDDSSSIVKIFSEETQPETDPYGGLGKKYLNK